METCGECKHFDGYDRCNKHDDCAEFGEKSCSWFEIIEAPATAQLTARVAELEGER